MAGTFDSEIEWLTTKMQCECLLNPLPENSALKEIIVNTSIAEWSPFVTSYQLPRNCAGDPTFLEHPDGLLQSQISSLKSRCHGLDLARIIRHTYPSLEYYAFDALNGTMLSLERGSAWDADGELCDDNEEQSSDEAGTDLFEYGSKSSSD